MLEVYDEKERLIATGSGFVVKDNKTLVTNCHVIEDADYIFAYSDDDNVYMITKVYYADEDTDLALLGFFSPTNLVPLKLNTDVLYRAEPVVAIGSPKGFKNTVSTGIISSIFSEKGIEYIQFTAPISSGSSGGAIFDDDGEVIGVSTMVYDDGGVAQNLNFAINASEIIKALGKIDGKWITFADYRKVSKPIPTPSPTVKPTATRKPTSTPRPTVKPTATRKPTSTPRPTATPLSYSKTYKQIKIGDKGEEVKELQRALINLGYLDSSVDGDFGKITTAAVIRFNLKNNTASYRNAYLATNNMQQLLYSGKAPKYSDSTKLPLLYILPQAYAEWESISNDRLQIHFQVTNISTNTKIAGFELYVYATDIWGHKIGAKTYSATTTKTIEAGKTVYSDYITLPNRSSISKIYVAIHKIAYSLTSYTIPDSEMDYGCWTYK